MINDAAASQSNEIASEESELAGKETEKNSSETENLSREVESAGEESSLLSQEQALSVPNDEILQETGPQGAVSERPEPKREHISPPSAKATKGQANPRATFFYRAKVACVVKGIFRRAGEIFEDISTDNHHLELLKNYKKSKASSKNNDNIGPSVADFDIYNNTNK
jgi:hypothetical protein